MKKIYLILAAFCVVCAAYSQTVKKPQCVEWLRDGKKIVYQVWPDRQSCYLTLTDVATNRIDTVFGGEHTSSLCLYISEVFIDTISRSLVIFYLDYKDPLWKNTIEYKVALYRLYEEDNKYLLLTEKEIDFYENGYTQYKKQDITLRRLTPTTFEFYRKESKINEPDRSLYNMRKQIEIDFKSGTVHIETTDTNRVCFEKYFDMSRIEHRCSFAGIPNYLLVTQLQLNRADTVFYTRENGTKQGLAPDPWYIEDAFMDKESKSLLVFYNKFSDGIRYLQLSLFQLHKGKKVYELIREVNVETWPESFNFFENMLKNEMKFIEEAQGSYTYTRIKPKATSDREPPTNVKKQIYVDFVKHQIAIENKTK